MKIIKPNPTATFTISSAAEWPSVLFETDTAGAHTWNWTISWGSFAKSGCESTANNRWDAKGAITNYGGTLTVRADAAGATASVTVKITGTNPSSAEIAAFLATKADSDGFEKILLHESRCMHFNKSCEPVKSFDNGYGLCQLTNPPPKFEQVWNWKLNVEGGLKLFAEKVKAARVYLGQGNRSYTKEQLRYEAVCRWNGGPYHEWDAKAGAWRRPDHILCDSQTGNIGWDLNDPENKGKTETDLHKRDAGRYSKAPGAGAHWKYLGVCYADRILG